MFCLKTPTDSGWAREAAGDLDGVLVDHAHCEMKAATNALSLVVRHPGEHALVRALTALAQEELEHFTRVVTFLEQRGLSLGSPPVDEYAAELRRATARLPRSEMPVVVDRLLIGALIEARSCERFKLLLDALPDDVPGDLRAFYRELFECEARHYRTYVDLAERAAAASGAPEGAVTERLHALADAEGTIVGRLAERARRATVHG